MTNRSSRSAFTLIELLVVITIIVLISAVALPTILPALGRRQVSEASRLLQGALVGARDAAIHTNAPAGIRLLPDPSFSGINPSTGQFDPLQPLAYSRIIPIAQPPNYTNGLCNVWAPTPALLQVAYPVVSAGASSASNYPISPGALVIEEAVLDNSQLPNDPTGWFWNVRVGDKLQINNAGPWYTVVGPMVIGPSNGNAELFVNVGAPGTDGPLIRTWGKAPDITTVYPEFLFLVNGQDDNQNGWSDEGWDGVDNNGDTVVDDVGEWEAEAWPVAIAAGLASSSGQGLSQASYSIQRRPIVAPNSRGLSLPSGVVIDATSWSLTEESSRLPINSLNGMVDLVVNQDGTISGAPLYSTPASYQMTGAFAEFWLAIREDVWAPRTTTSDGVIIPTSLVTGQTVYLPLGVMSSSHSQKSVTYSGPSLKGDYGVITLSGRTGQIVSSDDPLFDNPMSPFNGTAYQAAFPFLPGMQGQAQ